MRIKVHYLQVDAIGDTIVELLQTKLKALERLQQLRLVNSDGTVWPDTGTRYCGYQIDRVKLALKAFEGLE
jgi:hypothetical protein